MVLFIKTVKPDPDPVIAVVGTTWPKKSPYPGATPEPALDIEKSNT